MKIINYFPCCNVRKIIFLQAWCISILFSSQQWQKKVNLKEKIPTKNFCKFPYWEKKKMERFFFCFLISLSGKTPVTFTLINACVAKFKAASYNLQQLGLLLAWNINSILFPFFFFFPQTERYLGLFSQDKKKNPEKNTFFHERFELEGTGGKFQSENQQVKQFLSLTSLSDIVYPRFTNVA